MHGSPLSTDYRPDPQILTLAPWLADPVRPADFPEHIERFRNQRWADAVGLGALSEAEWTAHFARFEPLPGNLPQPLALRYHGHQFRNYNPQIGDGRGFLYAQMRDGRGRLLDLGTKGSGQTPWSRDGDGRLTLKGAVREVLATEMLEALGVNTSKSFSLIETGERLARNDEPSPTRASVLVRLSHSHIRIGSFQRFAYLGEQENIARLLDYTIQTYMPELWRDESSDRAVAFLEEVCRRVARMGAQWMVAGFVHGVLNTDNINVTGESFDYGPWRSAPTYDPNFTAAYFDESGLYAFGRQPDALMWNLTRLAECLLPLADQPRLQEALGVFEAAFHGEFADATLRRLGLWSENADQRLTVARAFFGFLYRSQAPFERAFFDWYAGLVSADRAARSPLAAFYASEDFAPVREALEAVPPTRSARLDNPYFRSDAPCTMLIDEVEAIWAPIAASDDWSAFHAKLAAIAQMAHAYGTTAAPG
jgi:uncharacterized protein YdiU (UPF0061 family)